MKKGVCLFCTLALLLCGGCDYREIDTLDIVSGMAVDRKSDGYSALLEIADVTAGSDDNPKARRVSTKGPSLTGALRSAGGQSGRQAYLGHTQLVLLGEQTARQGAGDIIDYLQRDSEAHMTLYLVVAEGEAAKLLETQGENTAAFGLAQAVEDSGKTGRAPNMPLYRFLADRNEEGVEGILPIMAMEGETPIVAGTALFRGEKMEGRLDEELTQALLMLRNEMETGTLTVGQGEEATAFRIEGCKTKLRFEGEGEDVKARYSVELKLTLDQSGREVNLAEEAERQRYESVARDAVQSRLNELIFMLQKDLALDSLGVGRQMHRHELAIWKQLGREWDVFFPQCDIAAQVTATLVGSGRTFR